MATLTTSYQYLGNSPETGPVIAQAGSYYSRLYLQAKVKSYNSANATITVRASIRNSWMGWSSTGTTIQLTGANTHKFVESGTSKWTGASTMSGSSSYKEVWSATYDFDVSYGSFNLGLKLTATGQGYSATISNQSCTVVQPGWTVSYNANGGTGAPANQQKLRDVDLTLSSTVPTKASTVTQGATVTFSDTYGTPSYLTYQTTGATVNYTFNSWNTNQDGSGDTYMPGGTYTENAALTLYAQWTATSDGSGAGIVKLPQSVSTTVGQNKYFAGWTTTNGDESTLVPAGYVATSDITLYALWKNIDSAIKYRTSGGTWVNF